ncbi:MAG: hypothetical protein HYX32_14670 [Actinobacteria bacterium]|nr:hypothetical protein [Actinomycetota bacterium]
MAATSRFPRPSSTASATSPPTRSLVLLGSIVPLFDITLGGPRLLHTLLGGVAALMLVVLATRQKRLLRRRLIGLPIGVLMHLVLDGVWTQTEVFWWPFFGTSFGPSRVPELDRPFGFVLLFEALGAGALVWCWRTFGFSDPKNRELFLRTGQLDREVTA